MRIKKMYQSDLPEGSILNTDSNSQTNTFSCNYINGKTGKILYYNSSGGSDTSVTLNDSAANYEFIEIYFRSNNGNEHVNSTKVYKPNGKYTNLGYTYLMGYAYIKHAKAYINGTTITLSDQCQYYIRDNATPILETDGSYIWIYAVVGYK